MGGDSVTVSTERLQKQTADVVTDLHYDIDATTSNLDGVSVGDPAAGEGIRAALAAVVKAWQGALPIMSRECTLMGQAVSATATMYVEVEVANQGRFRMFAE